MNWHLQDAKNNLSKVIRMARTDGPQTVTLRGERTAVILSAEEYDRMAKRRNTIVAYPPEGPGREDKFAEEVNRRSDTMIRDIDL